MAEKKTVDLLKLIELVEENHIIWDVRCRYYKLTEGKPMICKDIAEKLGSETRHLITNYNRMFNYRADVSSAQNLKYCYDLALLSDRCTIFYRRY
jgi:hypothetical protein